MNEVLRSFGYKGKSVRTLEIGSVVWWVLKDVCSVLGLSSTKWTANRLDEDEVSLTHLVDARGCKQRTYIINESGLYSVLLRSDKPEAKPFKQWVTHEVLPSIRKTGQYIAPKAEPQKAVRVETKYPDFECWPSLYEVNQATKIFWQYIEKRIDDTRLPEEDICHMSEETRLECALSEVWRQGKIWRKRHPDELEIGQYRPKTAVQHVVGDGFQKVLTFK